MTLSNFLLIFLLKKEESTTILLPTPENLEMVNEKITPPISNPCVTTVNNPPAETIINSVLSNCSSASCLPQYTSCSFDASCLKQYENTTTVILNSNKEEITEERKDSDDKVKKLKQQQYNDVPDSTVAIEEEFTTHSIDINSSKKSLGGVQVSHQGEENKVTNDNKRSFELDRPFTICSTTTRTTTHNS
jgi:hypothetical protein